MSNAQIYNHFRLAAIPSDIAAQAADLISSKYDEFAAPDSLNSLALKGLLQDFINLYALDADLAIAELKKGLV